MLPNLVIIGAMKCGTTSLHYYLNLHPEITMTTRKELDFFVEKKYVNKGLPWYEQHFQGDTKILGEASPNYTNQGKFPGVPERMYATLPTAKLIYLVRDPIQRMVAHYVHEYSSGAEQRPMAIALTEPAGNMYLDRSLYHAQISAFLNYFPRDQLLIVAAEDLRHQTAATLKDIFTFLDVDANFYSSKFSRQRHQSDRKRHKNQVGTAIAKSDLMKRLMKKVPHPWRGAVEDIIYRPFSQPINKPILTPETHSQLQQLLADDIHQFRQLTGHSFPGWTV